MLTTLETYLDNMVEHRYWCCRWFLSQSATSLSPCGTLVRPCGGVCNVANDCLVLTLTKLWPNYPGGTCISNMLDGLEFPNCPDKTSPRYQVRYMYVSPRIPAYSEIRIIPNPCGYYVTT